MAWQGRKYGRYLTDVLENLGKFVKKALAIDGENTCVKCTCETSEELFARMHIATHKPTSAQRLKVTIVSDVWLLSVALSCLIWHTSDFASPCQIRQTAPA